VLDTGNTDSAERVPGSTVAPAAPNRRRRRFLIVLAVFALLAGLGLTAGTYYVDSVPTPTDLALPESTTVYFADGRTPMATLGTENRTIVPYDEMNDSA
jgi:membrane carboxypeptidase/penicillin-binding protein